MDISHAPRWVNAPHASAGSRKRNASHATHAPPVVTGQARCEQRTPIGGSGQAIAQGLACGAPTQTNYGGPGPPSRVARQIGWRGEPPRGPHGLPPRDGRLEDALSPRRARGGGYSNILYMSNCIDLVA